MDIICNGEKKAVDEQSTLSDLVDSFDIDPRTLVAEVNGKIIEHSNFPERKIEEGDRIELIRFVGGG